MDREKNYEMENFQKVTINGVTVALPVLMKESEFLAIKEALENYIAPNEEESRVYTDPQRSDEFKLVDGIVEGSKNASFCFDKFSREKYKEDDLKKMILQCLSRCYASLSSAGLLFNFKYYIEYVSVLRIIYEQCAFVLNLCTNGSAGKSKSAQSCITYMDKLDTDQSKKYKAFYGVLSECAHLSIFKTHGKLDISEVDDVFTEDDKVAIKSTTKTINNYSIFKKTYDIYVDTCKYIQEKMFTSDNDLKIIIDELRTNRATTKYIYENGSLDFGAYLEEFSK